MSPTGGDPHPESEARILAAARAGDSEALAALYGRFGEDLYRVAHRLTASREDAEDVVHDLFVGLPLLLTKYEHEQRLGGWLRKVTVRLSLMRLRGEARRRESGLDAADRHPARDPAIVEAIDLAQAIDRLPPSLRSVFVLRQLEGFTYEEIAALTGLSAGAARVRFTRAMRRLRLLLEPDR